MNIKEFNKLINNISPHVTLGSNTHIYKIILWALNQSDIVVFRRNQAKKLWEKTPLPTWQYNDDYVVCYKKDAIMIERHLNDGLKLEQKAGKEWVDPRSTTITPHLVRYREKKPQVKSEYDIARAEADMQAESKEPIDVRKWHYGQGFSFSITSPWEFYYDENKPEDMEIGLQSLYVNNHIYRKKS